MDIEKILDAVEEKNLSIKDVKIDELVPNEVDGIIIGLVDNELQLHLDKDCTGAAYVKWKNGRGGIFYKDLKNWFHNKNHGQYVLLSGEDDKITIARLIEEEEVTVFDTLKLIDGKIKDKPYMRFRTIKLGEKLVKSDRYIEESKEEMISEHNLILPNHIASGEASTDSSGSNVSLFDD